MPPMEAIALTKQMAMLNKEVAKMATEAWARELTTFDADVMADSSINNLIFTKLKEVFAALLDAAVLAGSAIVVDRTAGQGSATAEVGSCAVPADTSQH